MFAKPVKKTATAVGTKQKALNKPKTVSVKAGLKAPQVKKSKIDNRPVKGKPPPREDAGYSLYSTDSEDQVDTAFKEMDMCEKILTHLKHKTKDTGHPKKKKKIKSPKPKALNDIPPNSDVIVNPAYGLPYGAANFLRQLHIQNEGPGYNSNPIFNSRLASSTPDPEKLLNDSAQIKLPDNSAQEVPERDMSGVSSIPPSMHHLRNMADMVDIYKRLELKKYQQLQEAAAVEELRKLHNDPNSKDRQTTSIPQLPSQGQVMFDLQGQQSKVQGQSFNSTEEVRQSLGSHGTASLGFNTEFIQQAQQQQQQEVDHDVRQTGFQPIAADSPFSSLNAGYQTQFPSTQDGEIRRDSSLTAFQHYLARESTGFLPPQSWLPEGQSQGHTEVRGQGQTSVEPLVLAQAPGADHVITTDGVQMSGRSEKSDSVQNSSTGTDYAILTRTDGQGQRLSLGSQKDSNVVFEKQNGLYQIHQNDKPSVEKDIDKRSNNSGSSSKGQSSIHEVPERDQPISKGQDSSVSTHATSEGTFTVKSQNSNSQNVSELSTPRNIQNASGTGSIVSQGGRVVFIPNNSSTQNTIGYIPGIPVIQDSNQPIGGIVSYDNLPQNQMHAGSFMSTGTGQNVAPMSQVTSQVPGQEMAAMSGYRSSANANAVAAGDVGIRKLRYLLTELMECNKVSKDVEICRLVEEIDGAVNSIPQLALTFNLQTEIDLAIQPLRSENSQLRRKLRLLNQQMKEKDMAPKDINFEILHLQTSNEALQRVVKEEKEVKTRLAAEVQYVLAEIHKMKVEKSKLIAEVSEKDTAQLKLRQEMLLDTQNMRHEIDLMRKDHEATVTKLESLDKENHILQITLKQRDAEIERQHEIVETMKESIADLLQELEQSKSGERTWDHNQSYGLNRLMRIVEEENTGYTKQPVQTRKAQRQRTPERTQRSPERRQRTPERRGIDFNTTVTSTNSTPRLTRAALAYHDRRTTPPARHQGYVGRPGPASESDIDTLVELQRKEKRHPAPRNIDEKTGKVVPHRRHSSSSPVRLKNDRLDNLRHQRTVSNPNYRKTVDKGEQRGKENNRQAREFENERFNWNVDNQRRVNVYDSDPYNGDDDYLLSPQETLAKDGITSTPSKRRVLNYGEFLPPQRRAVQSSRNLADRNAGPSNLSDVSNEQSRYSVTDYFKKYPQSTETIGRDDTIEQSRPLHGRQLREVQNQPVQHYRTVSDMDVKATIPSDVPSSRNVKQLTLFGGMVGDRTLSAIRDDDNVSSVSMSSVTTANTVDDTRFRSGIATLDANIAKLQQALQRTKSMLQ